MYNHIDELKLMELGRKGIYDPSTIMRNTAMNNFHNYSNILVKLLQNNEHILNQKVVNLPYNHDFSSLQLKLSLVSAAVRKRPWIKQLFHHFFWVDDRPLTYSAKPKYKELQPLASAMMVISDENPFLVMDDVMVLEVTWQQRTEPEWYISQSSWAFEYFSTYLLDCPILI